MSTTTTYYVATLSRYVLVDAIDEHEARIKGRAALQELYAGRDVSIEIRTIRSAATDEIDLMRWHNEMIASR